MKPFFLLLSLTLLLSCGRDPETGPYQTCRMAEITKGGSSSMPLDFRWEFKFDDQNQAIEKTEWDPPTLKRQVTTYVYEQGRLSELTNHIFIGRETPGKIKFYRQGNKIHISYIDTWLWPGKEWMHGIQVLDKNEHLASEKWYWVGDNGVLYQEGLARTEYKTDKIGNIIEADFYDDNNTLAAKVTYEYDNKKNPELTLPEATILKTNKNNVIRETHTALVGNVYPPVSVREYSYTYNAEGYPVSCSDGRVFSYRCR